MSTVNKSKISHGRNIYFSVFCDLSNSASVNEMFTNSDYQLQSGNITTNFTLEARQCEK